MLRALVAALLVANLAFFAWTAGWLDGVVGAPIGDREPERLQRQVRPETIRVLPEGTPASATVGAVDAGANGAGEARAAGPADAGAAGSAGEAAGRPTPTGGAASAAGSAAAVAAAATRCLEAGPFNDAGLAAAQAALQPTLPRGGWVAVASELPGSWVVYLGPYPSAEALARKKSELDRRQVAYQEPAAGTPLAAGLTLGRFGDRAAAMRALERFAEQDVRTARVVEVAAPRTRHLLRVEAADAALAARLAALRADALGRGFVPCAAPPPGA